MIKKAKLTYITIIFCVFLSACNIAGEKVGFQPYSAKASVSEPRQKLTENEKQGSAQDKAPSSSPAHKSYDELASELPKSSGSDILEIGERMFITQINDIFYNFDEYKDKTIIVEGMFTMFYSYDGTKKAPGVYRNGPGCCQNDGWAGFLLKYDGELPEGNEWIKVKGTPEIVKEGNYLCLYLNVISLEVRDERGAEFVCQ